MSQRAGQGAAGTDALPDLPPITEHESTVHASPLMSTPAESVLEKSDEDVVAAAERQRMMRYIEWENKLENAHIYMWIAKDFSWSSNNYYLGLIAGTAALVWYVRVCARACGYVFDLSWHLPALLLYPCVSGMTSHGTYPTYPFFSCILFPGASSSPPSASTGGIGRIST